MHRIDADQADDADRNGFLLAADRAADVDATAAQVCVEPGGVHLRPDEPERRAEPFNKRPVVPPARDEGHVRSLQLPQPNHASLSTTASHIRFMSATSYR